LPRLKQGRTALERPAFQESRQYKKPEGGTTEPRKGRALNSKSHEGREEERDYEMLKTGLQLTEVVGVCVEGVGMHLGEAIFFFLVLLFTL
jgi:hypothetical protein